MLNLRNKRGKINAKVKYMTYICVKVCSFSRKVIDVIVLSRCNTTKKIARYGYTGCNDITGQDMGERLGIDSALVRFVGIKMHFPRVKLRFVSFDVIAVVRQMKITGTCFIVISVIKPC